MFGNTNQITNHCQLTNNPQNDIIELNNEESKWFTSSNLNPIYGDIKWMTNITK